jgi:hypothetical protein
MEFYFATEKNGILSFASKWIEVENIILSEVSGSESQKSHVLPHMQITDFFFFFKHNKLLVFKFVN